MDDCFQNAAWQDRARCVDRREARYECHVDLGFADYVTKINTMWLVCETKSDILAPDGFDATALAGFAGLFRKLEHRLPTFSSWALQRIVGWETH
jgi:hypothetical protein